MSQVSRKFQGYLSHSWSQNWGEPCPERRAEDGSFTSAAAAATDHGVPGVEFELREEITIIPSP